MFFTIQKSAVFTERSQMCSDCWWNRRKYNLAIIMLFLYNMSIRVNRTKSKRNKSTYMYSAEPQKATCFHLSCCFSLNAMSTDFHIKMFSITFFYFQKQTDQDGFIFNFYLSQSFHVMPFDAVFVLFLGGSNMKSPFARHQN